MGMLLLILMTGALAYPRTQECRCPPQQQPWYGPMRSAVQTYCPQHDPNLVLGMIAVESCGDQYSTSRTGAMGYMQVMPGNLKGPERENPFSTSTNLQAGCRVLSECLEWARGVTSTALMCYHGGTDARNWGLRTRAYPNKVMACMPQSEAPRPQSGPFIPTQRAANSTPPYCNMFGVACWP